MAIAAFFLYCAVKAWPDVHRTMHTVVWQEAMSHLVIYVIVIVIVIKIFTHKR